MVLRDDNSKNFRLTKNHNLPYISHSYSNINTINEIFDNIKFNEKEWKSLEFRKEYIKWFFSNNKDASESECFNYIKCKLESKFNINNDLKKEIHSCILAVDIKKRAKKSIINQLSNLVDDNNNNICKDYSYEAFNKKTKEKKISTLFIIINIIMLQNLKNNNIKQFFGDCTYKCIPPTISKYKLYVISGFNLKERKIHICAYALLPDESFITYNKLFSILKNVYKFNQKYLL